MVLFQLVCDFVNERLDELPADTQTRQTTNQRVKEGGVCVCVFVWLRVLLTTEGQVVLTLNTDSLMSVLMSAEAAG